MAPSCSARACKRPARWLLSSWHSGAAMGALRAAAFAITYVRIDSVRPGALALLLAVDGFAALSLVPSVKYLPALGREDIISQRTGLYLLMVGLSAVLVIGAVTSLGAASPDGWGSWCYGPPSRWFSRGSRTGCSMPRPIGIYGCKPGRAAAETCPRR